MNKKRLLGVLILLGLIYGVGHIYFRSKTPALLKIALHTMEQSNLKVAHGEHKIGNYLFRPYVELSTLSLEPKSTALPKLKIHTQDPTRFMLNWWQGQSLTITNKGIGNAFIEYPNFTYALTSHWFQATVDSIDTAPELRELHADKIEVKFQEAAQQKVYAAEKVSIQNTQDPTASTLDVTLEAIQKIASDKSSQIIADQSQLKLIIPESIKHPFNANWFIVLAQSKETITIKEFQVNWKKASYSGQGSIGVDSNQNPHILLQSSMEDFETFVTNLATHPMLNPLLLKTWEAVLAILKATTKGKSIVFEYKNRSIYINGIEIVKNLDL